MTFVLHSEDSTPVRRNNVVLAWTSASERGSRLSGCVRAHGAQRGRGLAARVDGILPRYRPGAERCLVPMEEFDPGPVVTDTNGALSLLLMAERSPGNPFSPVSLPGGRTRRGTLSAVGRPGLSGTVLAASMDRKAVWLLYAAKTGRQEFVFHPSALIRSRGRYHLRGYRTDGRAAAGQRLDDRYVDVVPARSVEGIRTDGTIFVGLDDDDDWHTFETRKFVLSPDLSPEERLCYEHEYGIAETGVLERTNRRALMAYVVQELSERRCWRQDGTSVPVWGVGA